MRPGRRRANRPETVAQRGQPPPRIERGPFVALCRTGQGGGASWGLGPVCSRGRRPSPLPWALGPQVWGVSGSPTSEGQWEGVEEGSGVYKEGHPQETCLPPRRGLRKDTPPNLPLQALAVPLVTHRSCIILIYLFIEQIFIECLLQAVPSLRPTGALKTRPAPSCEAQGSGKASLTPLPAPGLGRGGPPSPLGVAPPAPSSQKATCQGQELAENRTEGWMLQRAAFSGVGNWKSRMLRASPVFKEAGRWQRGSCVCQKSMPDVGILVWS